MKSLSVFRNAPRVCAVLTVVAVCGLVVAASAQSPPQPAQSAKPTITITTVPPRGAGPDQTEPIAGSVAGVDTKQCKVVVFAKTDRWYVQPTIKEPDTPLDPSGRWENDTHLGSEYAALLVKLPYKAPGTMEALPSVGGDVIAFARVRARTRQ